MKALQATCLVGALAFTGMIHQVGENTPGETVLDAKPEAAVSAEMPAAPALTAALPEATFGPDTTVGADLAAVPAVVSAPSPTAKADIGDDPIETKSVDVSHQDLSRQDLGHQDTSHQDLSRQDLDHHDAAEAAPTTRAASDDAAKSLPVTSAPATKDFSYLIYYVWSELPPAEKPAQTVLNSFKDIPVGTPVEEIKRASDAFGLDFNFMKAVARIESGFDPKQRTGSYIGLFQLSKYEFNKFGSGDILSPRDNAVAAAYKIITEGILFGWVTHRTPSLNDLYLIHQQGWEGAAEHINQPDRIAWKSMCATSEGREKGEKWCKRAIWRNTLPKVKEAWKSVDNLTSGAFVDMWRTRVADFYSKYTATAVAERANQ